MGEEDRGMGEDERGWERMKEEGRELRYVAYELERFYPNLAYELERFYPNFAYELERLLYFCAVI